MALPGIGSVAYRERDSMFCPAKDLAVDFPATGLVAVSSFQRIGIYSKVFSLTLIFWYFVYLEPDPLCILWIFLTSHQLHRHQKGHRQQRGPQQESHSARRRHSEQNWILE